MQSLPIFLVEITHILEYIINVVRSTPNIKLKKKLESVLIFLKVIFEKDGNFKIDTLSTPDIL